MKYIQKTNHLTKAINGKDIVNDIELHVKKGEIYGILGLNGAGKTSIMKMITNLWKPTAGTIELFGETVTPQSYEILKRIGSIIEFPTFYEHMTGRKNLQIHCEYMGFSDSLSIDKTLALLDLSDAADKLVNSYSLGMKERLGIARAILCKPELLILDEPTNGLDPAGMKQVRDLLKCLSKEQDITVIISSHILSEIESIADTVGIIHHGKMIKEVSMKDIEKMNMNYIEVAVSDTKKATHVLIEQLNFSNFKVVDNDNVRIYDYNASTKVISKAFALNDVEIMAIGRNTETLEDYFLKLTGGAE